MGILGTSENNFEKLISRGERSGAFETLFEMSQKNTNAVRIAHSAIASMGVFERDADNRYKAQVNRAAIEAAQKPVYEVARAPVEQPEMSSEAYVESLLAESQQPSTEMEAFALDADAIRKKIQAHDAQQNPQ